MAQLAALPDRNAAFSEQKHLAALSTPVSSNGRLVFRHPSHLEQITGPPHAETLVIDNGVLDISEDGGAARRVELASHPALQALAMTIGETLAGDLAGLQRVYTVTASGSAAAWRITMVPLSGSLGRFIKAVTLDGVGGDLRGLDIAQANGDRQTMAIRPLP